MFRIEPHIHQRLSEASKKPLCAPGPRDPTETESDLPLCVCLSPAEAWVSTGHRSAEAWVSSGQGSAEGMGQQRHGVAVGMAGTGAMGAADLGGMAHGVSHLGGGRH